MPDREPSTSFSGQNVSTTQDTTQEDDTDTPVESEAIPLEELLDEPLGDPAAAGSMIEGKESQKNDPLTPDPPDSIDTSPTNVNMPIPPVMESERG